MIDRTDHLELLALIEGELDVKAADALRLRLASEPKALALVEKMRADRALLRSLPDPELPRDFLAQLEPILARTLLVESAPAESEPFKRPGEYRRQYRKRTRRIRWSRLSLAAILMLAVIIGVWAAAYNVFRKPETEKNSNVIAKNSSPSTTGNDSSMSALPDLAGTIHHYLPAPLPADRQLASASSATDLNRATPSIARTVTADFAILIHSADQSRAEKTLVSVAEKITDSAAVVRNFSFEEAKRLANDVRFAPHESGEDQAPISANIGEPAKSGVDRSTLKTLADSVRQHLKIAGGQSRESTGPGSGPLGGDRANAPSLEQQLEFSSRGASHTIAIPVADLNDLLGRIATQSGENSALCMLPKGDFMNEAAPPSASAINLWLSDAPLVRREIDRLIHTEPDAIVLVPVIVQADH